MAMPNQMLGANQANLFMAGISGQHAFPSHVQNQGLPHNSWRRDPNIFLMRRMMCKRIHAYFQRHAKYREWGDRVYNIVKKLESRLFVEAKTKLEYMDGKTLPRRLCHILKSSSKPKNPIFPSSPIHSAPPTSDQSTFSRNRPLVQIIEGTRGLGDPVKSIRTALSVPPLQNENGSVAGLSATSSLHYDAELLRYWVNLEATYWAYLEARALVQIGCKPPAATPIVEPLMKFSEENQSPAWTSTERENQKHAWKMGHREPVFTEPLTKCAEIQSPTCASMEEDDLNDACKMGHEDPVAEHFMNFQNNDYEMGREEPAAAEHLLKWVEETESPSSLRNIEGDYQNDFCKVGCEKSPLQNENGSVAGLSAASSSHYLNHMVDGIGMTVSMHPQIQNRFVDGQAAASSAHYLNSELHCSWAHSEDSALIQIGYKPPAAAPIVEPLMKFSEENQSPTWAITERDDQKHAWKMGHRELVVTEPLMKCAEIESPTCASMEEDDLNDACKMGHEDPFAEHFMNFQKNDYETGHEEPAAAEHLLKCVEETESPSSPRNIKTADQNDCCKVGHENFVDNFQNNDYEMGREEPASTEHLLKCVEETESPSSLRNMKGNDQNDCCKVGHEKSVDNCIDCEKTEFVQNFLEAPDEDIAVSGKIKEQTLSRNPKINVVSLLESFTPRQIKEHIQGLRQRINEGNSEGMEMQNVGDSVNETSCQLCAVEKHFLEPPPIYCSVCCHRIMWNQTYYTAASGEKQYYFCSKCHSMQSKKFNVDGVFIPKAHLEKQKNTEQLEEPATWQHQICSLFNHWRNQGGQAQYTCPHCCIQEMESGERKPLPKNAIPGAKDLLRTTLSDHIEQRLCRKLKEERQQRARLLGVNFDEVPGAKELVVRVVSSINKKFEVLPQLSKTFSKQGYPSEFPYRSKIGYLDYCKRRDFTSCHIWSSPPSKGDDYMLYCHPNSQKVPKSDMLRKWYQSMLQKAVEETIVVQCTNLYDHLFASADECETKVTVTHLPYFDGDYLPDAIEDAINILWKEEEEEVKLQGKGRERKRALKNVGYAKLSGGISMNTLLMEKEDFIVAVLQYSCSCCHKFIKFGNRWVSNLHRNFQLCHMCYKEPKFHDRGKHPSKLMEKHSFSKVVEKPLENRDEILESCIFQTRHTFLKFCQENSLQFDTLRRAKYSTTMLLDHLHNPSMQVSRENEQSITRSALTTT